MKEKIFNLFLYIDGEIINQLGVAVHELNGTDEEKMGFLKNAVKSDYKVADRIVVKSCSYGTSDSVFKYSSYFAMSRAGRNIEVFEEIFSIYGASKSPLFFVTSIVNGKPAIDIVSSHDPLYLGEYDNHLKIGDRMEDYLKSYITPDGFDMPKLMNDDYFAAIKLLFNDKYYVSCMKLIVSFIDTISFIEFGDVKGSFVGWLKLYSSIERIGITENQLWEFRNSLLHMSNLDSKRVLSGKEKRISFCVASKDYVPSSDSDIQYFNLNDLIDEMAQSLSNWIKSYNKHPEKWITFIERYDRVISDSRYAIQSIEQQS